MGKIKHKFKDNGRSKKLLAVVKFGDVPYYEDFTKRYIKLYAERHKYDFIEITQSKYIPLIKTKTQSKYTPVYEKYQMFDFLNKYKFVLLFDLDILPLPNSSDVYDRHQQGEFGMAMTYGSRRARQRMELIYEVHKDEVDKPKDHQFHLDYYGNGGVMSVDNTFDIDMEDFIQWHNCIHYADAPEEEALNMYLHQRKFDIGGVCNTKYQTLDVNSLESMKQDMIVHYHGRVGKKLLYNKEYRSKFREKFKKVYK